MVSAELARAQALSRSFSYPAEEREEVFAILEQITGRCRQPEWIDDMEEIARAYLLEFVLYPPTSKAVKKEHYRRVAKAAAELFALLDDRSALESGSALYLIDDCGADGENFAPRFNAALQKLAERAAERGKTGIIPGGETLPTWAVTGSSNVRNRMGQAMLVLYRKLTGGAPPSVYRDGPAARWLQLAVNPVMRFARDHLKAKETSTVSLTPDSAVDTIRLVKDAK